MTSVRMDKWLWAARFFKTRALAARACELGRIQSNGQPAKAFADEGIRVGLLLLVLARLVFLDDGVGEHAAVDVSQAPFVFTRHGVHVALAEKPEIVGAFQFLDGGGITVDLAHEELDGA